MKGEPCAQILGHIRIMEVKPAEEMCSGHRDIGRAQEQPASELKVGSVGVERADTLSWGGQRDLGRGPRSQDLLPDQLERC